MLQSCSANINELNPKITSDYIDNDYFEVIVGVISKLVSAEFGGANLGCVASEAQKVRLAAESKKFGLAILAEAKETGLVLDGSLAETQEFRFVTRFLAEARVRRHLVGIV